MAMLFGTQQGRLSGGYKASLVARVHMRLGNWRKSVMPSEVRLLLSRHPPVGQDAFQEDV